MFFYHDGLDDLVLWYRLHFVVRSSTHGDELFLTVRPWVQKETSEKRGQTDLAG